MWCFNIVCGLWFADVRTQAMYQLLDPGFIGLIFSCFSEDAHKVLVTLCFLYKVKLWHYSFCCWIAVSFSSFQVGRIQVIAFQSLDGKQRHLPPVNNSSIIEVESSLSSLENALSTSGSAMNENIEQDTGDSRAAKAKKVWWDANSCFKRWCFKSFLFLSTPICN